MTDMTNPIREALRGMDHEDDAQWTQDHLPMIAYIEGIVGANVSRQEVTDAAPAFSRHNLEVPTDDLSSEPEAAEEPEIEGLPGMVGEYAEGDLMPLRQFLRFLRQVPPEELDTLDVVVKAQYDEALKAMEDAKRIADNMKACWNHVKMRRKRIAPDVSNQEAIIAYIKKQTLNRGARAAATKEMLKGIDLNKIDPRAPIDRAFARRNQRGMNRPTR